MKKKYSLMLAFLMMLGVSACTTGGNDKKSTGISSSSSLVHSSSTQSSTNASSSTITSSSSTATSSSSSSSVSKKVMEHVNFPDVEVVYDGNSHTIEASVYPDGSTVTYLDNGPFVDVGEYEIKVRISHPDYEDYEDTATLVIKAATMSTISFEDSTLTFDGEPHTIEATGFPEDAVVTYTNNGPFTNVGEYEIKVRIELANYEPYEETKKLTINPADMDASAIEFENLTVAYTGDPYTIEATGIPEDVKFSYENAGPYTDVGEYEIVLKLEKENYNTLTTKAVLTITQATMPPFTFENLTVEYDGESHTIEATGFPEGSLVTYSNEGPYTEIGEYEIQVTVSHKNFETVTKTAKLNIVEPIEKLKQLKYYAHPYERKGVVIEFAEDYKTAKIYSNDYDLNEEARVSINGEELHIYTYHHSKNVEYVDIHARINSEGFKVYNVATASYYNANIYVTLDDYLPQFKPYYGKTYVDFSDSVDGEVYAPASHVEKYYDGSKWQETSGNAKGVAYTFEYLN